MHGGVVADGEFVVAGGEGSVAFELVDAALDGVALPVGGGVEGWRASAFRAFPASLAAWSISLAIVASTLPLPRRITRPETARND